MTQRRGLLSSAYDPFPHPGYIWAFQQAVESRLCDTIIAAVNAEPHIERPWKHPPVMTVQERCMMVGVIRYVSVVIVYHTEQELLDWMAANRPDLRILGEDYIGKRFPGDDMGIPTFYAKRTDWSRTDIVARINGDSIKP